MSQDNFIQIKNLELVEKRLKNIPNGVEKAVSRTINKTIRSLKKELKQEVVKNYGITSTNIEKALTVNYAYSTKLHGNIKSRAPLISLYKFLKSKNKNEIFVVIKRKEGKKKVVGKSQLKGKPFIATMGNGHSGIFQRKESGTLKELKTLSIPQMLGSKTVMEYLEKNKKIDEILEKNLDIEIEKILKGYV